MMIIIIIIIIIKQEHLIAFKHASDVVSIVSKRNFEQLGIEADLE